MKHSLFLLLILSTIIISCDSGDKSTDSTVVKASALYTDIVINEIQSNATTGYISEDFVELYNTSESLYTFTANEWYITDSDGAPAHIFYIPGNTVIQGHGYLVLLNDVTDMTFITDTPAGSIYCVADGINKNFGLGKTDSINLFYTGSSNSTPDVAVDSSSWSGTHVTTRSRIPDGGSWDSSDSHTPTPGSTNGSRGISN